MQIDDLLRLHSEEAILRMGKNLNIVYKLNRNVTHFQKTALFAQLKSFYIAPNTDIGQQSVYPMMYQTSQLTVREVSNKEVLKTKDLLNHHYSYCMHHSFLTLLMLCEALTSFLKYLYTKQKE